MSILLALFVLGIVVMLHELGHFAVAKISGMRVERFAIGMGPAIASFEKGETEYVIGLIPAGGYVMVTGEHNPMDTSDDLPADDPRRYPNRPLSHRLLFCMAGSFMNILTAVVLLLVIYMAIGVNVPQVDSPPIIDTVAEDTPAAQAGLKAGDKILTVNGQETATWDAVTNLIQKEGNQPIHLTVLREQQKRPLEIVPFYNAEAKRYYIGVNKKLVYIPKKLDFNEAIKASSFTTFKMSTMIIDAVGNLVSGKTAVNDKERGLTGPVGIVKIINTSMHEGLQSFLFLLSALSVNLGLLNLLPIPAVDGSKILFLIIEGIRGIPVDPRKEGLVNFIGFVFLMMLMIYVTINDVSRLF